MSPSGVTFGTEMKDFPPFLDAGLEYLRQHCLDEEGIFRVSGDNNLLTILKERVQQHKPIDMEKDCGVLQNRPHNIANLLKWYLRELPEPLCTFECYEMFIATDSIPNENNAQLDCLKKVIHFLPTNNRKLLKKFCMFLHEVHTRSNLNRMNAAALSIVFAPNILKPARSSSTTNPLAIMSELRSSQQVVENIIKNADYLFADEEDNKTKKTDQLEGATVKDITKAIRRLTVKLSKAAEDLQENKDGSALADKDQKVILDKMRRNSELQKELLQTMDQLEASNTTAPNPNLQQVKMTLEDLSILTEVDDILTLKILFENGVIDEKIFNVKKTELMNKQK